MQAFDHRCADFGVPAATVLQQEHSNVAKLGEIGSIDDRSAAPLGCHQPGPRKYRKMRGERVLRHLQKPGEITRGQAVGLVLHQGAKGQQPRRLSKGGKRQYGTLVFHISGDTEMTIGCQASTRWSSRCEACCVADLIQSRLERFTVERLERQGGEDFNAAADHRIKLVEKGCSL